MHRRQFLALGGILSATALTGCSLSRTESRTETAYPIKRVSFIVPFPAGSGPDAPARIVAKQLETILGIRCIIENVDGGRSLTGLYKIASAKPDGSTIGWASASGVALNAHLTKDTPYRGPSSLTGLAKAKTVINAIAANPSTGWTTVEDLVAAAKDRPGKITVGVPEASSSMTIQFKLFAQAAGLDFQYVAYGGGKNVLPAVNGTVDLTVSQVGSLYQFAEAGDLDWIATVGGNAPDNLDIGSVDDAGYDTSAYQGWEGVVAPANLPDNITTMLNDALKTAIQSKEYTEFCDTTYSIADYVPHKQFQAEMEKAWDDAPELIKTFGIKG